MRSFHWKYQDRTTYMGIFNDLFNWKPEREENEFSLGRFSDAYKPSASYTIWENALLAFESEKYINSAKLLLDFLKNPEQENISYSEMDGKLSFEFLQGSKKIEGYINEEKFRAESKLAHADELNIGLMRRLLDKNYLLKYSRFALDEERNIIMLFDSYTVDASPNKLYQGLKEMATQADKLDDILVGEFKGLTPINTSHIIDRKETVKDAQYQYLQNKLDECFNEIENGKLNTDQFPGGLSYLLLALNYKIDYLLKPEGFLMDTVEQNHRLYFANDGKEVGFKNKLFINAFRKVMERGKDDIKMELYDVISTFGLTTPSSHENLVSFIDTELPNITWYKENKHDAIALSIPAYIVGYCLFNFALPLPDMKLLDLFYRITEPEFFYGSEKQSKFISSGRPNSKAIRREIDLIIDKYDQVYPELSVSHGMLDFSSMVSFSESYLYMIKSLNLTQS